MAATKTEQPQIILPGDVLPASVTGLDEDAPVIKLGPGLLMQEDRIGAIRAGVLKHSSSANRWWVETNQRRVSV